ncbi:hypothetical protein PMAYCL1PPCAC_26889, partial [Pristionchus mayeri]
KVVVSSESKLISISLKNDRCSMRYSEDESAIFVNPPADFYVSTIDLSLKDNEGKEMSSVSFSAGCTSGQQRIRTDGLLSIVFDADESITLISDTLLKVFPTGCSDLNENSVKFEMSVNVNLVNVIPNTLESKSPLVNIYSGSMKVGDSTVPVSKEMLALSSPFFNVLFYGNFGERKKDNFEIKEVDTDDFIWFLNSIQTRKYFCMSVNQALVALTYADRFGMLNLHKHVSAYLKFYSLAKEDIKDTYILSSRFDNEELIVWVLGQCTDSKEMFDLVIECAPFGNMNTVVSALTILQDSFLSICADAAGLTKCLVNERKAAPIHLRCYDAKNILEMERYFSLSLDSDGDFYWSALWNAIPEEYGSITVDGRKRPIDGENSAYCQDRSLKMMEVIAYRS